MAKLVVTIDGPAASGKSTIARLVAERIGASFLDTGAMYRAVTLAAMRAGVDIEDEQQLLGVLDGSSFDFAVRDGKMAASIDGADVTEEIRRLEVTANARYIASAAKVREKLVAMQRAFAAKQEKIVTEGRDQGTVAFADADVKFYLTADLDERARRRQAELQTEGKGISIEQIKADIKSRDNSDSNRNVGPMKAAGDSIVIDTTNLNIDGVVAKLLGYIEGHG